MQDEPLDEEQFRAELMSGWWEHFGKIELRHTLLLWWDPVAVYGEPLNESEYDYEVAALYPLLRRGAAHDDVRTYLSNAGVGSRPVDDERAAVKVVEWWTRAMGRLSSLNRIELP